MPITPEEQRKASFKHVYGKNQTNPTFDLESEALESGHQIYSDELLSAAGNIAFASNAPTTQTSNSVWTISSGGSMANIWANGSFQKTAQSGGTDSNFEEVFLPLVEVDDGHEVHAAFISASQASNGKQTPGELVEYSEGRLKNWLTPTKYGPGYTVQVFPSLANQSGPDTNNNINDYGRSTPSNKKYGAWAFDYYQGLLYFANPETGTLNLSGYQKPFWIKGYRYIGPTGSAAAGAGGISEIDATVSTNLNFNPTSNQLTLGSDSVTVSPATTQVTSLLFETSSVGKIFVGLKDNIYATNSLAIADKLFFQGGDQIRGSSGTYTADFEFGIGSPIIFKAGNVMAPIGIGGSLTFFPGQNLSHNAHIAQMGSAVPNGLWKQFSGDANFLTDRVLSGGRLNIGHGQQYGVPNRGYVNIEEDPQYSSPKNSYTLGVFTSKNYFSNLAPNRSAHFSYRNQDGTNDLYSYQKDSKIVLGHANRQLEAATFKYNWKSAELGIFVNSKDLATYDTDDYRYKPSEQSGLWIKHGGNISIGGHYSTAKLTVDGKSPSTGDNLLAIPGVVQSPTSSAAITGSETNFNEYLKVGDSVTVLKERNPFAGSLLLMSSNGLLDFGRQSSTLDPLTNNFANGDYCKIGQYTFTFTDDASEVFVGFGQAKVFLGSSAYEAIQNLLELHNSINRDNQPLRINFRLINKPGLIGSYPELGATDQFGCLDVRSDEPDHTIMDVGLVGFKSSEGNYYTSSGFTTECLPPPNFADYKVEDYVNSTSYKILQTSSYAYSTSVPVERSYTRTIASIESSDTLTLNSAIPEILYDARIYKSTNLFDVIDSSGLNVLSVTDNHISSSLTISASAFYLNGVEFTGSSGTGTGAGFPFTGSAEILGTLSASGHISASSFIGDGSQLTGVATSGDYVVSSGTASLSHITASGAISASGTIVASNLSGTNTGDQDLSSYSTIAQLNASSSALQTAINAKSSIAQLNASSSALQIAINAKSSITQLNASSSALQGNIDAKSSIAQLNVSSSALQGNIDAKSSITQLNASSSALQTNIDAKSSIIQLNASSSALQTAINAKASITQLNVSSSALQTNIDAKSSITQLNASSSALQTNIDAKAPIANPSFTGHITASGNISASGIITANSIIGTLGTAAQTNITSVGTLASVTVTGNINANGNIVGDNGTNITNISSIQCNALAANANSTTQISLQNSQILALVNDTDVFDVTETLFTHHAQVKFNSHITASGNVSASGNIEANQYKILFNSSSAFLFSEVAGAMQWGDQNITSYRIGKPTSNSQLKVEGSITASGDLMFNKIDGGTF